MKSTTMGVTKKYFLYVGIAGGVIALWGYAVSYASSAGGEQAVHNNKPQVVVEAPKPAQQLEDPRDLLKRYLPFETPRRIPIIEANGYFPCNDCHDGVDPAPNPTIRQLEDEHDDIVLSHGAGRFWCTTCHNPAGPDYLRSIKGQAISFDEPYLLCGQCHFQQQQDYFGGAHGKRIGSWQGKKVIASCTDCHDPHAPAFPPRKPFAAPLPRKGLKPQTSVVHHKRPWEMIEQRFRHHDESNKDGVNSHE